MPQVLKRFTVGNCSATVFAQEITTQEGRVVLKTVSLQRSYRDKRGAWQYATSLRVNDVPRAILALLRAYEYLTGELSQTRLPTGAKA